jgi:hypothetical protein
MEAWHKRTQAKGAYDRYHNDEAHAERQRERMRCYSKKNGHKIKRYRMTRALAWDWFQRLTEEAREAADKVMKRVMKDKFISFMDLARSRYSK